MNTLSKIKSLYEDANKTMSFIESYRDSISSPQVDKHKLRFEKGSSNSNFCTISLPVILSCYTGNYGSSSCYTKDICRNNKEWLDAYVSWLNKNMQLVFDGVSEEIRNHADKMKDDAKKELQIAQEEYRNIFKEDL